MSSFTVTCIKENEDGSADVEIEVGKEAQQKIMEEGIQFVFIKGILEGTTDDILRWATLGKQEENTNRLLDEIHRLSYDEDTK
jgi:hypothetical protein